MYGQPLEPTDLEPLGLAADAPGGLRGAIVRRYFEASRVRAISELDALAVACLRELDDLDS